ncbi:peptidoglycan-recognition protein LC-like [Contarinia nasturtii]|uniref:peptidoglycan-recognition protein LC-like n=1 Tax=Contarinia nasturtii TaxID=265458 RepID=UPI0012D450B5|nr:peptidoglycan-recognition protein LC-like [Contarinia nasturtii]
MIKTNIFSSVLGAAESTVNIDNRKDDESAIATTPTLKSNRTPTIQIDDAIRKLINTNSAATILEKRNSDFDDCSTNENDSSEVYSDSDIEEVINCNDKNQCLSSSAIALANKNVDSPNLCQSSILCTNNDAKPNIGSIAVQNSSDITFGNKTFYQGPVTIKQFVYDKNKWNETEPRTKQYENYNLGYINNSNEDISTHQKYFPNDKENPCELQKKSKWTKKRTLKRAVIGGVIACSLLAIIIIILQPSSSGHHEHSSSSDLLPNITEPLRFVNRSDWEALPPKHKLEPLHLPVQRAIIAHTFTKSCTTQESCSDEVRAIQKYHIDENEWDDIGYNFLVGGDGAIYVGRGWDNQGAHTKGYNVGSICIAFIGSFDEEEPPKLQIYEAQKLIKFGVMLEKLSPDFRLYGQRQLKSTKSPGLLLYEIIKKWAHWTEKIE